MKNIIEWVKRSPLGTIIEAIRVTNTEFSLRDKGWDVQCIGYGDEGYDFRARRMERVYNPVENLILNVGVARVGHDRATEIIARYNEAGYDIHDLHRTGAVSELGLTMEDNPYIWGRKYMEAGMFEPVAVLQSANIEADYVNQSNDGFQFGLSF